MDKKGKTKYRIGRSIEEVIARRRLDGKQLPPLKSVQSQSQSNFFSASQASFFKDIKNNDTNVGIDPFYNQKDEYDKTMNNKVAVVQTATGEKSLSKDQVIGMLSDYCKHLEGKLNPDNSVARMFATPALNYETSTRGSAYPTFTGTMIKKEQAENDDIFPAPPDSSSNFNSTGTGAGGTSRMPIAPSVSNTLNQTQSSHHTHHGHHHSHQHQNARKSEAAHELHSDIQGN